MLKLLLLLEMFWRGEFSIDENEEPKEDASAAPTQDPEKKVTLEYTNYLRLYFLPSPPLLLKMSPNVVLIGCLYHIKCNN